MSDPCFRRINRNIVECKDGYKFFNINAVNVLIETLWNVKIISLKPFSIIFPRINRNIVECKAYPVPYQQRR